MTKRARLPSRLVLALGLSAAGALVVAALLDLGDPGVAALERQEVEALSIASLARASWDERLASTEPVAEAVAVHRTERGQEWAAPAALAPLAGQGDLDQLRIEAASASAAVGDLKEARRQLVTVAGRGAALSGEALLRLCRIEAGAGSTEAALGAYLEHGAKAPWSAAVDGTSGRLLALFCAADGAPLAVRTKLGDELREALARNVVSLPGPLDRVDVLISGWDVCVDPWWTALALRATAVLGSTEERWRAAFREPERRALAFVRLGETSASGEEWALRTMSEEAWLAARRDGAGSHLTIHTAAQLDEALGDHPGPSLHGLVPSAFGASSGLTSVVKSGALRGTDVALMVAHPDPDKVANRERRRVRLMRAGLLALAAVIAFATAAAARMTAKARELHSLRTTFVASISHDLRTPLASIGLMAENLGSGYAKGREEVYVGSIQRETARLRRLVDDLLDFGRLERGLLPNVTRVSVDLVPWLDQVAARERARCAAEGTALSFEMEGILGSASVDAPALERAISNLVDNALKHGEARSIRMRARHESGAILAIEVEDAGKGLGGGSVHEHLFEPFERRSENEGTGLGLTIVRAIAEAHGGRATLGAGPGGRGAVARIEIAGCEAEPGEPAA